MLLYLVYFCLASGAVAQVIRNGGCEWDNAASVRNLNLTGLLGEWHQIQRISNPDETGQCSTINIEVNTTSPTPLTISSREVHGDHVHDRKGYIVLRNETLGLFRIQFENSSYDTVVMATDYNKVALLYSCMPLSDTNNSAVLAWVYGRATSLEQTDKTNIQVQIAMDQDLRNATWVEIQHTKEACGISAGVATSISRAVVLLSVMIFGKSFIA